MTAFVDTHNMISYLIKSNASEGFNQIINCLNGSSIKYALTINPNIYVSCIKQFWNSVVVKKFNDVTRLQALVDKKRVIITEATIRDALRLDDAEGADEVHDEGVSAAEGDVSAADDVVLTAVKVAQALEITKLKQRVKKLERRNKASKLKRLKKVGSAQRIKTSNDTVMDVVSKQGRMIANMDADVDIILEDAKEVVVENAARRRKGVVIRDTEETATPSTIIHSEAKSKDKGKGILVEEPKPLKKQAQIEQDEAYARELEAELNKNIDWDEVIDHVKRKQKEDNAMKRYQA
nr:xylulose kinase-1 [Tanacetum cinerariifolium]